MKKSWLYIAMVAVLAIGSPVRAEEKRVTAAWTYDETALQAESVAGFRIKNAYNETVVDQIPATERTASFTIVSDGKTCHSFYLTAYTADDETRPSNILTWCPPRKVFTGVGTFSIEIKD